MAGNFRAEFGDAGAAFFKVGLPCVAVFEGDGGFVLFIEFRLKGLEIELRPVGEAFGEFGAFAAGGEVGQDAAAVWADSARNAICFRVSSDAVGIGTVST